MDNKKRIRDLTNTTTAPQNTDFLVLDNGTTNKISRADLLAGTPLPADTVDTQAMVDGAVTPGKLGDTGWQSISLESDYSAVSSLAVRKIGAVVYVRGGISRSGNFVGNEDVGTLASQFRPNNEVRFPLSSLQTVNSGILSLRITSGGTLTIFKSGDIASNTARLDVVSFVN